MSQLARSARLDRYEQLSMIGEGAYGVVYEALDRSTGERIALKELRQINPASLARFKLEFRTVQEVHHPNLVRLDYLFEDRGEWVIAMELVPGTDLLTHVYSDESATGFDDPTLRAAFLQLADGLIALHGAGLLHRDLKPSNVRVTPEGRVVVLDFGLTTALDDMTQSAVTDAFGTVAYMAPEQALGRKLGPSSDWYSFGVCLYEALTGFRPFDARSPDALLLAKQHSIPPPASSCASGIPSDLDALCASLLAIEPQARPSADEVRRVLARFAPGAVPHTGIPPANVSTSSSFEGREPELRELNNALARVAAGEHRVVLIEGESGIGKSAIIGQFVRASASWPCEAYVLRSRCYENELLAFKAFDGALDELARILGALDADARREMVPLQAALLCRLFPALAVVEQISRAPLHGLAADPSAQRLQAFAAFRRLIAKLSEHKPVVLAIEDLQWADAESFSLLRTLLDGAQPVRCLVIATVRPAAELDTATAESIATLRNQPGVSVLSLHGLTRADAWKLARELVRPSLPESWLEIIVRESAGHPLFLSVLARFAESHDPKAAEELTLDAALASQLAGLSEKARHLVDTAAVAATPTAAPLCGRVAGLSDNELGPLVSELCAHQLLRRRRAGEIACFHDRIRRVVTERMAPARARGLHAAFARVLARQPDVDASVLAPHHDAAGELELAYEAYRRAAEHASSTLALSRAAMLYERALDVAIRLGLPQSQLVALRVARGHALAGSGRSAEAAGEYLNAAGHASGEDRTRFRIWAAQHLLQSARVNEGMEAARALLAELDVPLPRSVASSIVQMAWNRAALKLTGLEINPKPMPIDPQARMRLDALNGLGMPVQWVDPFAGVALSVRYLRMARALGERTHLARALAEEAFARSLSPSQAGEADKLLARARELAGDDPPPELEVNLSFREGSVATTQWNLARARERLEHAQRVGTESCPDQPWLLTHVRTNLGSVLANIGEHAVLADCTTMWLAEARDRNDQFARATLEGLGYGCFRHLMVDQPDQAEMSLAAALSPWPAEPFSFAHFGAMVGDMFVQLYRGKDYGRNWLAREHKRLSRSTLLKHGMAQNTLIVLHANANLAARSVATGEEARRLVDQVRKAARQLKSIPSALSIIMRLGLEAQLAALDRKPEIALAITNQLRQHPSVRANIASQQVFDYFDGQLLGGSEGRQKQRSVLAFFAAQGWKQPQRAVAMVWPAVDCLQASE